MISANNSSLFLSVKLVYLSSRILNPLLLLSRVRILVSVEVRERISSTYRQVLLDSL